VKLNVLAALAAAVAGMWIPALAEPAPALIWEIGVRDNSFSEFALAPKKYGEFKQDGLFVVGQSDTRKDWPYVQPGPLDGWAGGRPHRFAILFDIEKIVPGALTLKIDLVDTQSGAPPQLDIKINGHSFACSLPAGSGDATINGDPRGGKEYLLDVPVPAEWLATGTNEISIESKAGSWMLYDWIGFEAPAGTETGAVTSAYGAQAPVQTPALVRRDGKLFSVMQMDVFYAGDGPKEVSVKVGDLELQPVTLESGKRAIDVFGPASSIDQIVTVQLLVDGGVAASHEVVVKPVRKWEVYLLPHSHVDIGYTHVQTDIERRQAEHIRNAVKISRATENYPEGAQFKWNTEVQWPIEKFLQRAGKEEVADFVEAVRKGWIGVDALYANQLTALSRPEELARLVWHAQTLRDRFGFEIDSAMITDVPGYTWGIIPVLAQSGVKYWSIGPNYGHRIGYTLAEWGDRPFYWVSPSGREKVLVWVATSGYSAFHAGPMRDGEKVFAFLDLLEKKGFPYDIAYMRYSIGGDNGPPDPELGDVVKTWNETYAYPKLRIATTHELFRALETRYGDRIPAASGDFTPYWEDGAGSSARETGLARDAAERITQAEALWAMNRCETGCPRTQFDQAWNNVILYNEHTWGAYNSISEPDAEFVKKQWAIKQAFAVDASRASRALLCMAVCGMAPASCAGCCGGGAPPELPKVEAVLVQNTNSWLRTGLVTIPADWPRAGDWVVDDGGATVFSQRLLNGDLAFMANDVPAFGSRKHYVHSGETNQAGSAQVAGNTLTNGVLTVVVNTTTGSIESITGNASGRQIVNPEKGVNQYWYVPGRNPEEAVTNSGARITVKETGPLVASLVVESAVPGCRKLTREIRLVSGLDRVDIINVVDKEPVRTKESVHFGFAFSVPEGVMRMDTPWAVVRPECDQLPGSCKNYYTVQRWVDVSNQDYGVTWSPIDAPLVEVGKIRVDGPFVKTIEPSQTLYSYVMNNYWETNYKADQEGPTVFRYSIWPHGRFDSAAAARFGVETSQPLVAAPALPTGPVAPPLLEIEPAGVIATGLKISQDGNDFIVRLFGASGKPESVRLTWRGKGQPQMWLSDLSEKPGEKIDGTVDIPAWGMVTVRVDGKGQRVGTKDGGP